MSSIIVYRLNALKTVPIASQHGTKQQLIQVENTFWLIPQFISKIFIHGVIHQIW